MRQRKRYTNDDLLLIEAFTSNFKNLTLTETVKALKSNFPDRTENAIRGMVIKHFKGKKLSIRFTKEEDDLICKTLNEYSFNLGRGFEELSEKLNRSVGSVTVRWYGRLKKESLNNNSHPFVITGKENHGSCKNIWRGKEEQKENFRIGINGVYYDSTTSTFCNNLTF